MSAVPRPTGRMRRYPALVFLALAAVLATLLPSALRVPLSGPSATAEIAPVPGKSNNANGNLASLDATSTNGLGYGLGSGGTGGDGGGGAGGTPPPSRQGSNPVQKRCVGKPPYTRQTEDPLSPPCVAYFKGDNFGSTWEGVTRDQVNVIVWSDCGTDGSVQLVDLNVPQYDGYHWSEYLHYFNDRFQTYGRTVHAWVTVQRSGAKQATNCEDNSPTTRAAVQNAYDIGHPFFITGFYDDFSSEAISQEAARLKVMSEALHPTRDFTTAVAPYVVSYGPDINSVADHLTGLICSTLAGRQVTFGEPSDTGKRRKFGIVYNEPSDAANKGIDLVRSDVQNRCGDQAGDMVVGVAGRRPTADDMTQMQAKGVTTVLWLDNQVPLPDTGKTPASAWHPEYVLVTDSIVGNNALSRPDGAATMSTAVGLMLDRRRGAYNSQPERIALRDVCPDCTPNEIDISIYNELLMLFTGIQAAGPRLTPQNFDKGMRAQPPHDHGDPYVPAAYFGPGDHSFIKDYALAWWDSSGNAPDSAEPGCWRLVDNGRRYLADDWASRQGGDAAIHQQVPAEPCQGEQ